MSETTTPLRSSSSYHAISRYAMWLLVAFFIALAVFAVRNLQQGQVELDHAAEARKWTEVTADVSEAVHQLQRERGLSSGYLASGGASFRAALHDQPMVTDVALERMQLALGTQLGDSRDGRIDADSIAAMLAGTRRLVLDQRLGREAAVDRYTGLIDQMFVLLLQQSAASGDMLRPQLAFISFLRAKEAAGKERALLAAVLSSGDFAYFSRIATFHALRAEASVWISQFRSLASERSLRGYEAIGDLDIVPELNSIRRRVVALGHSAPQPRGELPSAERWFALSTQQINAMKSLEDELGRDIVTRSQRQESAARSSLVLNGASALTSFLLAGLLLWIILRGKQQADANLNLADKVFSNSVEAMVVTDVNSRVIEVNPAFNVITGYTRDEVLGQHVRILKSGRHDADFYQSMWDRIGRDGSWEGEIWNRRKNGDIYPALLSIVAVKNPKGSIVNYIAMTVDLSQHKKTEALLEQLRTFDALTGLLSREALRSAADRAVANTRGSDRRFAVLELGLDRFKVINDSLGHTIGDQILVQAAERVRGVLRRHDAAARPGGDRFTLILEDIESAQNVGAICEKLLTAFLVPIYAGPHSLHVSISIGVAVYPEDGIGPEDLQRNAESAMYNAKSDGRGCYRFYSADMNLEGARLLVLEGLLRQALNKGEFTLNYQPQVDAHSHALVGVEALLRWDNPELGRVSPVQFIPMAEETGLILPIGDWVLNESCRQARRWLDELGCEIPVAVNLSARQFRQSDLLATIQQALDAAQLPSHMLEMEITEGSLITDPSEAVDVLRGLRAMGVRTAIDDFGTGYSSLAYLKTFPLDRLKIDRAFVKDLPADPSDCAITRAVVALGRHLNMEVLAEGVETAEQEVFLAQSGCHVIQGYLHGKPMSAEDIAKNIRSGVWGALDKPRRND
jgi:diguanylate cyclase (GGDEF)-like protein/PAS domain S-box-containing protein